ncbi:10587_t:CDS:2, partial [Acaulospora colombiana]
MSLAGVNSFSPFSPTTQHYATSADSDIEQDYARTPSYSNDESNLEDNFSERALDDSEEENEHYLNAASSFTTEDEEDDDEMECSSDSDSDITEDEQNGSTVLNHRFENENNFNLHRNGDVVINVPPPSSTSISVASQQKQGPLRFGFPDSQESRSHEVDGEDEDDGSSTNSYDASSSRKRARSFSNDWTNMHPHPIQFGSLEPVNRVITNRQVVNHGLRVPSTHSPSLPTPSRPSIGNGVQIDYSQEMTDVSPTPLPNLYYSRTNNYTTYSQSSSASASPS